MKITIELESFAVKVFVVLPIVFWCAWEGQIEVVAAAIALISVLNP